MPSTWINEDGQRAQTRPCPRPGCGREVPIRRYRYDTLRQIGWPLFRVARYVEGCGPGQELIRSRPMTIPTDQRIKAQTRAKRAALTATSTAAPIFLADEGGRAET